MKKIIISLFVLGCIFSAVVAFAQPMDLSQLSAEQKQNLEKAIASQDPATIKAVMESFGIAMPSIAEMEKRKEQQRGEYVKSVDIRGEMDMPMLTKEQRNKLKEVRMTGDAEAVHALLLSFGITVPHPEEMEKKMTERNAKMQEVKTAIAEGDYEAYQEAVAGTMMADKVDGTTFETLAKADDLREAGDTASAVAMVKDMLGMHKDFTKKFVRQNLTAEDKVLAQEAKALMAAGDTVSAEAIFADLKEKYEVELAQPIKRFSLFGWLKQKRN